MNFCILSSRRGKCNLCILGACLRGVAPGFSALFGDEIFVKLSCVLAALLA